MDGEASQENESFLEDEEPESHADRHSGRVEQDKDQHDSEDGSSTMTGQDPWQSGGAVNRVAEINEHVFEELAMDASTVQEVQNSWNLFLRGADSKEAAGEAIYAAFFEAAPSLQNLFKTPRAVMAIRFMNGFGGIIRALDDPKALKGIVETLGFQHLELEVTVPRVIIFRDSIVDLLSVELGEDRFNSRARDGWASMLNYVGGAYIYIRVKFTDRLKILSTSWATANNKKTVVEEGEENEGALVLKTQEGNPEELNGSAERAEVSRQENQGQPLKQTGNAKPKKGLFSLLRRGAATADKLQKQVSARTAATGSGSSFEHSRNSTDTGTGFRNTAVPTTYKEMFLFNAAVMGFASSAWMDEVLLSFDTIVTNVSNSYRLQEECDVLALRIAKYKGVINLPEYRSVMLASLRSLVPRDWSSDHEVAWSWLWENVERMLKSTMGKPAKQEKALERLMRSLDESQLAVIRRKLYAKFFALSPAGQDFFNQSSTRLDFIADRIMAMTLDIFKDPPKMVEDISALGLRHVGYGVPTDLFGPFVTAAVQVIRETTPDDAAEEAFRWSLSLVSRILVRVINEGSTIVMKAINANSGRQLRRAVGCAPRGKRAIWMLNVQVGTQSISPLLWAIQTGSLDAAKAIIMDLLTIRADRDHYYYGVDDMFGRHDDIVKQLCTEAPALLPVFLDGLIWRSRLTLNGQRRVNYYIKHLLVDKDGKFSEALECFVDTSDPKLICHPVLVLVTDMIWSRVAFYTFLRGKTWFLFTLIIFVLAESVIDQKNQATAVVSFVGRIFIYVFSLGRYVISHTMKVIKDYWSRDVFWLAIVPVPAYLENWQELLSLMLTCTLLMMLLVEPMLHCLGRPEREATFIEDCGLPHELHKTYSIFAMITSLLYYALLIDFSVFSTRISAFVLVCFRVLSEVALFVGSILFLVLAFASALSALDGDNEDFEGIPKAAVSLMKIFFGMYPSERYEAMIEEPEQMVAVVVFLILAIIFLLNMLIAQLNSSYRTSYQDMLGLARLNRGKVVVETMPLVPPTRWQRFIASLKLDEKLEFNEGDVGFAGGVQVTEPASANPTSKDTIKRFGGSTSPALQWPAEEEQDIDAIADRFDKLEKMMQRMMKKKSSRGKARGGPSSAGQSAAMSSSQSSSGGGSEDNDSDS